MGPFRWQGQSYLVNESGMEHYKWNNNVHDCMKLKYSKRHSSGFLSQIYEWILMDILWKCYLILFKNRHYFMNLSFNSAVNPTLCHKLFFYAKNFGQYWWIPHLHVPSLRIVQAKKLPGEIITKTALHVFPGWKICGSRVRRRPRSSISFYFIVYRDEIL